MMRFTKLAPGHVLRPREVEDSPHEDSESGEEDDATRRDDLNDIVDEMENVGTQKGAGGDLNLGQNEDDDEDEGEDDSNSEFSEEDSEDEADTLSDDEFDDVGDLGDGYDSH